MIRSMTSVLKVQYLVRIRNCGLYNANRLSQRVCPGLVKNLDGHRGMQTSPLNSNQTNIDRSLMRLDNEIRKSGRINRHEIEEILQDMKDLKKATSNQSLMIIRCCGELVPGEIPTNRTKLVEEVWKTFENLNVPMDISHYNALLRVYLENEHKFNPTDFLQLLSGKDIEPNRVTYQRLIARYCQDGDIDGASTILQHMKEKQLPINEHVFNALVLGHAQANDMESAEGIISVMKQAGLEPNDDTYSTLMCGYAKKGDIENIERIIKDCTEKEIFLIDKDFLNVIFALASSGNDHLVDQIIPHLKRYSGYNQDATNLIFRLVNIGKEDLAYKILKTMVRGMRQDELTPSGTFFIKQMVHSATPTEKLIQFCKEMEKEDLNKTALSRATEFSFATKNHDKVVDLLEALQQSGIPIRQHFFWPFFASSKSESEVYEGLQHMAYFGMSPNAETFRDYLIPALLTKHSNESIERIIEKLSSFTQTSLNNVGLFVMQHLILTQQLDIAARIAGKYRVRLNAPFIRKGLVEAYIKTKNSKSFVQIVGNTGSEEDANAREYVGMVILDLLESTKSTKEKSKFLLPVLNEFLNAGLGLSNSGAELIQNSLGEDINDEISNVIVQLTSPDLKTKIGVAQRKQGEAVPLEEKPTAELEQLLQQSIDAGNPNKTIKKTLLFNYCREKQWEKADALKKALVSEGFVLQVGLKALFLDLYSQQDMLPEAKAMYSEIVDSLDTSIDGSKLLRYALLLFTHGEYEECLNVLKRQSREDSRKGSSNFSYSALSWKLLNTVAETKNVEQVHEVYKSLQENGFVSVNNSILGPLVKVHLLRGDTDAAVDEFERCVREHHCTPIKQELFCQLIKNDDADKLQRVMDLSTNLHGEVNSLYDLVFAFIQCGKVRQARKILETPGIRARNDKLENSCQRLMEEGRIQELENLIDVTRDLIEVDRNSMYYYLLKAYCKAENIEKAEGVWTKLQEENIHPSSELLQYLANFLQSHKQPVPFVVEAQSSEKPSKNQTQTEYRVLLESNEIDKALRIKQRSDSSGTPLSYGDISFLIEKMLHAERLGEAARLSEELFDKGSHPTPRSLRVLVGKLAASGNVEALTRLESKLTNDLRRKVLFSSRLCAAYAIAGKGREYIDKYLIKQVEALTGDPEKDKDVIIPVVYAIVERTEELLPEIEKLSNICSEKGNYKLHNTLWIHALMTKNVERSRELWEPLKSLKNVMFRSVTNTAWRNQDIEMAKELDSQVRTSVNLSPKSKGLSASIVLDTLCLRGEPEAALEYLSKTLENISLQDLNYNSLITLKTKLEAINKQFPYEIPKIQQRRSRRTDTSSSSDSDSD